MKVAEIKELTDKEILERIDAEKETLLKLKMNHTVSPLEDPLKLNKGRKVIARLHTILRQRTLNK